MAERLTESEVSKSFTEQELRTSEQARIYQKLGELEDILEKYGVESFELLEHIIKKGMVINSVIEDFAKEEYDKIKQDRDTWQKACELACKNMKLPVDILIGNKEFNECHSIVEYFYQQAKKENDNK